MATIPQAIAALDKQRRDLANNLTIQGVPAQPSDTLSTLVPKVLDITPPPEPSVFEIDPRWNWYDLKAILANDTRPYPYKIIEAIYAHSPTTTLNMGGLSAISTSDGSFYTATATHTWDETQDRQLYGVHKNPDGTESLVKGPKSRYIIKYYAGNNQPLIPLMECYYFVVSGLTFTKTNSVLGGATAVGVKKHLITFDLINGADMQQVTNLDLSYMFGLCYALVAIPKFNTSSVVNMTNMFNSCVSLISVPQLDTSNVINMNRMFFNCYNLLSVPLLNTSKVTDMGYMFGNCLKVNSIPLLDTANVTDASYLFYACRSLKNIPPVNLSKATKINNMFNSCAANIFAPKLDPIVATDATSTFNGCNSMRAIPPMDTSIMQIMSSMFNSCHSLISISMLDMSAVSTAPTDMFVGCHSLVTANLKGLRIALNLNIEPYLLSRDSMLFIFNNRNMAITGSITLTLGSTNLAKLSTADKAIATANRITLA